MQEQIIAKIKETIAPEIENWEAQAFAYIKNLEKYCKEDVYKEAKGATAIFQLKTKAGWTKAMDKFFGHRPEDLKKLIHREAEAKLSKIDVAVAKKLEGVDVKSVEMIHFTTQAKDAFCEGSWRINGDKVFSFRTIYAGGYNIQQLHIRTLYTYK